MIDSDTATAADQMGGGYAAQHYLPAGPENTKKKKYYVEGIGCRRSARVRSHAWVGNC
jgi:hypothetical protein